MLKSTQKLSVVKLALCQLATCPFRTPLGFARKALEGVPSPDKQLQYCADGEALLHPY